jgi:phosphate transport system protein
MSPRLHFDEQLEILNQELLEMCSLIEGAIKGAIAALVDDDKARARQIIKNDVQIDEIERRIESQCLKLLLQQQPVARDLRSISAALKMITDMERVGDQAADICEVILRIEGDLPLDKVVHLSAMATATSSMVTGAIDAFVERNVDFARAVIGDDEEVDRLFVVVRDELLDYIHADKRHGEMAMDLMMIAKYFERIGDHAENIAEWVEYSITGVHKGVNLYSDDDNSDTSNDEIVL